MDRTVPRTGSEEIELYIRTYYSLLRSTADVEIKTLEEVHANMGSSLHPDARSSMVDVSALLYSTLRLPACIGQVERVVLGQSQAAFIERGVGDIETWEPVSSVARRRRSFFDGQDTLAVYIASRSDIDDMMPLLTALQIEWNKLHQIFHGGLIRAFLDDPIDNEEGMGILAHGLGVSLEDVERLRRVWGDRFWERLLAIADRKKRFRVSLLGGSLNDYRRAVQIWWDRAEMKCGKMFERPVYFVSSNTHSLVNLITSFPLRHKSELLEYLGCDECEDLRLEWEDIKAQEVPSSEENFLYYLYKKFAAGEEGAKLDKARIKDEADVGLVYVDSDFSFDVDIQVLALNDLKPEWLDPRLQRDDLGVLANSDALIVNIDYPLGMAAYLILSYLATRVGALQGVYITGKAATLNGVIGDVMIPSVVHDEQSQNTYLFDNCFRAVDVGDLVYGSKLDNQKAVSVRGTYLQTPRYMDVFYREGYTDIEMEAGPYLSAIYELARPKGYPNNELVNLYGLPFDLGILHYASDTPLSKGKNLGAGSLSYYGMDPTYATSLAIVRRILDMEIGRLKQGTAE
jgi:hypothetical protein